MVLTKNTRNPMDKKVIAINSFDLNNWYRFNIRNISKEMLIDFSKPIDITQIGLFAEEHDLFFAALPNNLDIFKQKNGWLVPIEAIEALIPLSEQALHTLSTRNSNLTFAPPLERKYYEKIMHERNFYLSEAGSEMIINIFSLEKELVINYKKNFLASMQKYPDLDNKLRDKSNLFDWLVFYERSEPYSINNSGFIFDTGAIGKNYLLTKNINLNDYKSFGRFCKNNENEERIFGKFQIEYDQNDELQILNKNLSCIENDVANNILIIAFYMKFRKMIRDKDHKKFQKEAQAFLEKSKKECSIALFFIGLFFGSTEFVDLYYERNFSLLKTFTGKPHKHTTSNKKTPEEASIKFDYALFEQIKLEIQKGKKEPTKTLLKSIKEVFDVFRFDSSVNGFIESLEKNISIPKTDEKKKYTKEGIINSIRTILKH